MSAGSRGFAWSLALAVAGIGALLPRAAAADEEVAGFLGAFCAAVERNDEDYVRQHVRLPLQVRVIVDENAGHPRTTSKRLRTPGAVLQARLCEGIDFATARVEQSKKTWRILADVGESDAALEIARLKGRLVLVSYLQPARAPVRPQTSER